MIFTPLKTSHVEFCLLIVKQKIYTAE